MLKHLYLNAVPLAIISIIYGPHNLYFENFFKSVIIVARYVLHISLIRGCQETCRLAMDVFSNLPVNWVKEVLDNKRSLTTFVLSAFLLVYFRENILTDEFPFLFIAYLVLQYQMMSEEKPPIINYGVGMACSFFEGYLIHVIPSDGFRFVGFQENIRCFQDSQGVCFPVKRLFIVVTKSLFCPPDMSHFNKANRPDLPYMEAIKSLEDVMKDVAGVKNRTYRNSAYKIVRPGKPSVHLCVEFATPLHTFHKVLEKRALYDKLCDVNVEEVVKDFCEQLTKIISRSPECRDKCELVHYDDTNPNENLADVLLDKISELEPKYEDVIRRWNENRGEM